MKNSKKVALGGMIAALSLALMFLTGLFPFATFAIPGVAGVLLIVLVIELGRMQAFLAFLAVAILSIFITPDREAALVYVAFLGYYPIVKSKLEQCKSRVTEYLCKVLLFSAAYFACYLLAVFVLGLEVMISIWLVLGGYLVLLAVFFLYDLVVGRLAYLYATQWRKRFFRH